MLNCLLILEQKDGQLTLPSLHLCARLQGFPGRSGVSMAALVFGACQAEYLGKLGGYGIKSLYQAEGQEAADNETRLRVIRKVVREHHFSLLILPGTWRSRELAPALTWQLEAGLAGDCEGLIFSEGRLEAVVQTYNRQYQSLVELIGQHNVVMMSDLDPGPEEAPSGGECSIRLVAGAESEAELKQKTGLYEAMPPLLEAGGPESHANPAARVIGSFKVSSIQLDIDEADLIVGIGRGLQAQHDLDSARELAVLLSAALAGSRPAVDAGFIPFSRQIGQTGRIVAPQVYLAIGISGAPQHISGVDRAKIIAVNNDPCAPILRIADLGVIGDFREVVPLLVNRLRQEKEGWHEQAE